MKKFSVTILNHTRIFIAFLLVLTTIYFSIKIAIEIENLLIAISFPIFLVIIILILSVYSIYGILHITVINDELLFSWKRKYMFNFKKVENIKLKDIKTLVINNSKLDNSGSMELLSKIITNNKEIKLVIGALWRRDADEFIEFMKRNTNAIIVDSWHIYKKNGVLNVLYYLSLLILVIGAGIIITTFIIGIKVKFHLIFYFIGVCSILISNMLLLKQKMR